MKTAVLLAFVSAVVAQNLDIIAQLPSCATGCVLSGIGSSGCGFDIKCACENAGYQESTAACFAEACKDVPGAVQKALEVGISICADAGVIVSPPVSSLPPSTTPPPPVSTPPTEPTTTVTEAPETTPAPEETGDDDDDDYVEETTFVTVTSCSSTKPGDEPTLVPTPPVNNGTGNATQTAEPPVETVPDSAAGAAQLSGLVLAGGLMAALYNL